MVDSMNNSVVTQNLTVLLICLLTMYFLRVTLSV